MFYDRYVELCKQKGVTPTAAALEIGLSKATPTKWKRSGATPYFTYDLAIFVMYYFFRFRNIFYTLEN